VTTRDAGGARLAELLGALSLATDLGAAWPPETAARTSLLAVGLARRLGLAEAAAADVYYLALLRSVACTSFSHELAASWGDDILVRRLLDPLDKAGPEEMLAAADTLAAEQGPQAAGHLLSPAGKELGDAMCLAHRDVGRRFAERLGLGEAVADGLGQVYERWDGNGMPGPLSGEEIPLAVRIVHVAYVAEHALRAGGPPLVVEVVRRRSGGHFDPAVAAALLDDPEAVLAPVAAESVWDRLLDAEPEPRRRVDESRIDDALAAFADFADLKSPFLLGHSSGVARLAAGAAEAAGLDADSVERVRRAGLVHDLGRASVSSGIWDKAGELTRAEWERVRLHAHYSERVLSSTPLLAPLGALAGLHHERLDGSGYHRGATAAQLSRPARLLAAADVYAALREERPQRPALDALEAARRLGAEVEAGRLDGDAARAVLAAAGETRAAVPASRPAGLTEREVEVLRLVAAGRTARQIAAELVISVRTATHHTEHIYAKLGVSSRAGAALFALEHGLLEDGKDFP
jgi:HD-GYP domain-containing protein (c-di-GMP phosphodiesterase class II)